MSKLFMRVLVRQVDIRVILIWVEYPYSSLQWLALLAPDCS
jgi:hypothetical protein